MSQHNTRCHNKYSTNSKVHWSPKTDGKNLDSPSCQLLHDRLAVGCKSAMATVFEKSSLCFPRSSNYLHKCLKTQPLTEEHTLLYPGVRYLVPEIQFNDNRWLLPHIGNHRQFLLKSSYLKSFLWLHRKCRYHFIFILLY